MRKQLHPAKEQYSIISFFMSPLQSVIKGFSFSLKKLNTWLKSTYGTWVKRVVLWILYALIIRYIIVENFYKDTTLVMSWVTTGLILQTIFTYYLFGEYILPRYVYKLNIVLFCLYYLFFHIIIYESNYLLFWNLSMFPHGARLERDWERLREAGLLGFMTNGVASFWSFFYSTPFAIILLTVRAVKDMTRLRTENLLLEREKLNTELDFLKAQVNPHFLFNTLNSVYSRIFDIDERAADLILRLSELMRYNLYETDLPKIGLDKELAYIQNYLNLERNRLSDRYVVIDYEQSGQPEQYQIAPLLLIAFVENAFKHGIKGVTEPAYVQVSADVTVGQLVFRVENSVPDKRPVAETEKKSGGIGLGNVRRRLDTLYNHKYELIVTPAENTYEITLTIQVELLL